MHILRHNRDALGVDGAQVRVLKQTDQIGLGRLLQCHQGRALEAQIIVELLRQLAHEPLEGQLANQQLRALLVVADLAKRDRARAVPVRLLDAPRLRLQNLAMAARYLSSELLTRRLAARALARYVLRAGHLDCRMQVDLSVCCNKFNWEGAINKVSL